ncbi:helix-turn-helix domain-containing protein [Chryseolinea sp. T2]|uniref:helix-turn-helix domain-containing protein n=1 Tax=Chryseolinea sp. T2 TaxID=3129255 RepID=UPI0030775347
MKQKKGKKPFPVFSKDDRKRIVDLIERGEISRSQAMEQYGISSVETIRSWILRYSTSPESILGKVFTKAEKRQAAYRIIAGEVTSSQLAIELSVDPNSLRRWVREVKSETGYGESIKNPHSAKLMAVQSQTVEDLLLKIAALNTLIDIAEKELGIDIRKKSGTKQ